MKNDKEKRVLFIGTQIKPTSAKYTDFFSEVCFLDYDIIVVDPFNGILRGNKYDYTSHFINGDTIRFHKYEKDTLNLFLRDFKTTIGKLKEFYDLGHLIVIFGHDMPKLTLHDPGYTRIDLNLFMPWGEKSLNKGIGNNLQILDKSFADFFDKSQNNWEYQATYNIISTPKEKIASIYGKPEHIVSAIVRNENNGRYIVTPKLLSYSSDINLIKQLSYIDETTTKNKIKPALPEWSKQIVLPNELEQLEKVRSLEETIELATKDLKKQKKLLEEIQNLKLLFTGKDSALEEAVIIVLNELGFDKVEKGPKKRADIIAEYKGKVLAVEVQGTTKGAKEDHYRSLLSWVGEVAEQKNTPDVDGLLVGNPFVETELEKRDKLDSWPGKTLEHCKKRSFCAILGIQLLGMYIKAKLKPEYKETLVMSLFDTSGEYPDFKNYHDFIKIYSEPLRNSNAAA